MYVPLSSSLWRTLQIVGRKIIVDGNYLPTTLNAHFDFAIPDNFSTTLAPPGGKHPNYKKHYLRQKLNTKFLEKLWFYWNEVGIFWRKPVIVHNKETNEKKPTFFNLSPSKDSVFTISLSSLCVCNEHNSIFQSAISILFLP